MRDTRYVDMIEFGIEGWLERRKRYGMNGRSRSLFVPTFGSVPVGQPEHIQYRSEQKVALQTPYDQLHFYFHLPSQHRLRDAWDLAAG